MARKFSIRGAAWFCGGTLVSAGGLDILKIDKNSTDEIMALPKFLCWLRCCFQCSLSCVS